MNRALILVDLQNDFAPGGAIPTTGVQEALAAINYAQLRFDLIVAAQDWHPPNHQFFASSHPKRKAGDVIDLHGIPTVLQPRHCAQHTHGAETVPGLLLRNLQRVIRKGTDPTVDGRSAFFDDSPARPTGLEEFLKQHGVGTVYVVGLGTEVAVKWTAIDARRLGFETFLVEDGCAALNRKPHDLAHAVEEMRASGVSMVRGSML